MRHIFLNIILYLCIQAAFAQQQMQVKKNDYHSFLPKQKSISQELIQNTSEKNLQHPEFGVLPYNAPCEDCYEDLAKRTTDSRYFIKNGSHGKEFFIQKANGATNYKDADEYIKAIDWNLYPTPDAGIYEAASQPLPTKIDFIDQYTSITLADKLEFKYNNQLKLFYTSSVEHSLNSEYHPDYSNYTAGKDGAYITDLFSKTDCEISVRKGAIKTNFIIKDKSVVENSNYLVIEDFIPLPAGYSLKEDDVNGYYLPNGFWKGNISLFNEASLKLLTIQKPLILDNVKTKFHNKEQYDAISYNLIPGDDGYYLQIIVETKWLLSEERNYPVIIDPTLIGEATYTAGDIGFEFNAACFDTDDYCDYFLDITVPGKTTLTAAYFDGTYYSQNFGCFFTTDCLMKEAAFRILGPCDDSPSPTSYWTCLPPAGDTAGTCYGIDLDMFNTIACIPPQCEDYEFTFEMRTFMCSCTKPPCDITCHFMPTDSWVITIEGKTVEENNIESELFPEFTICEGDTIDLSATGIWGVPPYTYEWEELGLFADTVFVFPNDTTVYTSIIHDICDMRDTVYQVVNVIPSPTLSPGPFEACYDVIA
ncbi:MAG: hypothetical protein H7Y00_09370, partial [Fimbriimonadaceae bacterium]|nr:hypothetical protein [Chitinophagales bacterium]